MNTVIDGTLLHSINTQGQPDCIKAFPTAYRDDALNGTFIAATYAYHPHSGMRTGSLIAFNPCHMLQRNPEGDIEHATTSCHLAYKELSGVLSCCWIKTQEYYGAACITADLSVVTLKVDTERNDSCQDHTLSLTTCHEIQLDRESDAIGLSLVHYQHNARLASVTASDGMVYIVEDGERTQKWKAHDMETWISTFHPTNPNIILTGTLNLCGIYQGAGADDCIINVFDRRQPPKPIHTITRHSAGVTALQLMKSDTNVLFTGSFDKQLMTFDMRNLKTHTHVASLDTPIWYIDFMEEEMLHIAGCYDGAFVYAPKGTDADYHLQKKFTPRNTLIYGTAHITLDTKTVQVCCDFYNKQIHFWS